jgi:ferredoxin-type protein NapG
MDKSRRRFFGDVARTAGGAALVGLGLGLYARKSASLPAEALRPPGALTENDFTGACVRCGLCVRDCPYDTLKLARFEHSVPAGTPYFTARDIPCEMCEDIPCVEACPTGALDPAMTNIDDARMGVAVVVDQENCLNFLGLRCDVCHRVCPLIDEAITIERQHNARSGKHAFMLPTVHAEACTGCGKCEYACVLPEAAIKVLPQRLARGAGGDHYRFGWEEKQRAGESLVPEDPEHEYHLPEGLDYDYSGEGLVPEELPETPFPDDPLETLNQGANP